MTQVIKIKRSTVNTAPSSLAQGELAYSAVTNEAHKLFIGRPGGTSGDIDVIGGKYYTDIVDNATDANTASTLVKRDALGNFSATTITADLTGNVTGNVTGNSTTATTLATARNFSVSGDASTASAVTFDGSGDVDLAITIADSGVTAGQYGSTTEIPVLTVDSRGFVTDIEVASISTSLGISADTGTDSIALAEDTLIFEGGTGVTTTVTSATNTVTFDIGQDVSTTADVTFNNVTVNGVLNTDDVTAASVTTSGSVIIQGNLTVNGTTTTVNSNTVEIGDNILVLNSDETSSASQDAGIEVERGTDDNVLLLWDETNNRWSFTNDGANYHYIPVTSEYDNYGKWVITDGTNSTDVTSQTTITFAATNLSVTENGGTVTYSVPIATTAVKGIASFDTNYFTVTSGAVTLANVDGGTF